MVARIKNAVEKELLRYASGLKSGRGASRELYGNMASFVLRNGKRLRPVLFVLGYLAFARRAAKGLYRSAAGLELLHDFFLIHDDIIDDSCMRRGSHSMHRMLERYARTGGTGFDGKGLAIAAGDAACAMALEEFFAIDEEPRRKAAALKILFQTIRCTAEGEFEELLLSGRDMARIKKSTIYRVYDLKTARYTFSSPLILGATLAGAARRDIERLAEYGIRLGRAFQIKDDLLDMFGKEEDTGKPSMTDLKESKKTLLLWHAYRSVRPAERAFMRKVLSKRGKRPCELQKMRRIAHDSGAAEICTKEIDSLLAESTRLIAPIKMRPRHKSALLEYTHTLIAL
jgi:geranylgeranyl diphosphate synthase type I